MHAANARGFAHDRLHLPTVAEAEFGSSEVREEAWKGIETGHRLPAGWRPLNARRYRPEVRCAERSANLLLLLSNAGCLRPQCHWRDPMPTPVSCLGG